MAALAVLVAAIGVFVTLAMGGPSWLLPLALVGFVAFTVGVLLGHGPLAAAGVTALALATALATDHSLVGFLVVAATGLTVSALLVVVDASWWLRREPQVDPAVFVGLASTLAPVWAVGMAWLRPPSGSRGWLEPASGSCRWPWW
jgi:hypothetical protein